MKNKYQRLSKEDKKLARQEYKNQEDSKGVYKRVKRIYITCSLGIIYAIGLFAFDLMSKSSIWDYIIDSVLLIFCLVVVLKANDIHKSEINNYLISKSKKSK